MAGLVKKLLSLVITLFVLCLSSCGKYRPFVYHTPIIEENVGQMLQCIIDGDAEKLLTFFTEDMRENESEETLEEIEELFKFIDGDITSYSYSSGFTRKSISNFEYKLYYCTPIFERAETTAGKIYTIQFDYYHIWKEKPEQEGLGKIIAFSGEDWGDSDKGVVVGKNYKLPSTWS